MISCTEVKVDEAGNYMHSSYQNVLLDNVIKTRTKAQHICEFTPSPIANTINRYFNKIQISCPDNYDLNHLFSHICLLVGQKNISLNFPTSDEFYNFITYVLATGAANLDKTKEISLIEQAKQFFPHKKEKNLS